MALSDGTAIELARANRLRGATLSPSGEWLIYYRTFAPDPAQNGLWLVRSDGSERRQLDRSLFGAYQWRPCPNCASDDERLLVIPFDPEADYHTFWEVSVATGEARQLTDPDITPFKIANGDWQLSTDGRHVAYVESADRNIWVIDLP